MTKIICRSYAGEKDLQSMAELLIAVRDANSIARYPEAGDLEELLAIEAVRNNTRLWWEPDKELAAFAIVDAYHNLWFETRLGEWAGQIEKEIIDWGIHCIQMETIDPDGEASLDASCREDDKTRIEFLEAHGFKRQEITTLHLVQALTEPIPEPQLPDGFIMRYVAGEHEVEDLVRLHRGAFGTENMTVEERLSIMRVRDYDPELDLLVTTPEGRMAAYCLCSIDKGENTVNRGKHGTIDTIAVHPDFRGLGLAKALLMAGMLKLKQRGAEMSVMSTSSENSAMQHTALGVGYSVHSKTLWYSLPIPIEC